MKWDRVISALRSLLHFNFGRRNGTRHEQTQRLQIRRPEDLANFLIRDFASTLFVIPGAVHGLAPEAAGSFLRETRDILSDSGGYEKRCGMLLSFAALLEKPSMKSMADLCSFIDAPSQQDLKRSLDGDGTGYYGLAVLNCFSLLIGKAALTSSRRMRPVLDDFQGRQIRILNLEQAQIHQEWRLVRQVLKKLDTHSSSRAVAQTLIKWQRQRESDLGKLDYLSFLAPVIVELSDRLLSCS